MKKILLFRSVAAVTALSAVLYLGGCANPGFTGINGLLHPPRLSETQNAIHDVLKNYTGGELQLVYPRENEEKSAYFFADLNGDGRDEAVAFYRVIVGDAAPLTSMVVLERQSDGWTVMDEETLYSSEITTFSITAHERPLIGVSLPYAGSDGSNLLELFHYGEDGLTQVSSVPFLIGTNCDLNMDGVEEYLLVSYGGHGDHDRDMVVAGLYCWDPASPGDLSLMASCPVTPDVSLYTQLLTQKEEDRTCFYLDGYQGSSIVTDILCCREEKGTIFLENLTWDLSSAQYPRSRNVASCDMDNDGVIEIAGQKPMPGYSDTDKLPVRLTSWYEFHDGEFLKEQTAFVSGLYQYQFFLPEDWLDEVTAYYASDWKEVVFCLYDAESFTPDSSSAKEGAFLGLRVCSVNEWKLGQIEPEYQQVETYGQLALLMRVYDSTSKYLLSKEEISERLQPLE